MKKKLFDYVIGNPPYQEETRDTSDKPTYNHFMNGAFEVSDKVELITPARFLFNAGKTPKDWNRKMLSDEHFKVMHYEQNSSAIFPGTDIKGGVAITYRDAKREFGPIEVFSHFDELNSIRQKVMDCGTFESLSELVYAPESYKFTNEIHAENPWVEERLSKGHYIDITTNIFEKIPELLFDNKPVDKDEYVGLYGLTKEGRATKWIKRKYIKSHANLDYYKIFIPKSNGSGALGEVLSTPLIGQPLIGHTQTFISIGRFKKECEAEALLKYVKSKFARTLLGILKITQDNKKRCWKYVPLQNFTSESDIDWTKPVHEIDRQLYRKYGLDAKEIDFIETHVKEMA